MEKGTEIICRFSAKIMRKNDDKRPRTMKTVDQELNLDKYYSAVNGIHFTYLFAYNNHLFKEINVDCNCTPLCLVFV